MSVLPRTSSWLTACALVTVVAFAIGFAIGTAFPSPVSVIAGFAVGVIMGRHTMWLARWFDARRSS